MQQSLTEELSLKFGVKYFADRFFYFAIAAALPALLAVTWVVPNWHQHIVINTALLFSFIIWQPIIEEMLFRGIIQGQLIKNNWAKLNYYGFSLANVITSLLFMSMHFINHSAFWAVSVILPSLVFGYFRDKYSQIYPALILHSSYNAFYFLAVALLNQQTPFL